MSEVTREAQLGWEARIGRPAAVAAFLSAALAFASVLIQTARIGAPDNDRETLVLFDEHHGDFFASLGLQVVSYFLLAATLLYLLRATTYRRPETPKFAVGLLVLAPLLLGVGALLNQLELNHVADQFVSSEAKGDAVEEVLVELERLAENLIDDRNKLGGALAQGGTLCFALSFVLVSLNAMRAGLLSRFMGILGVIVGGLLVIPLLPGTVVQLFWLVAIGVLFLGRWPGGRGPAWETGEAVPWPSAADVRDRQSREPPGAAHDDEPGPKASAEMPDRPASRKRKKKRR